MRHAVARTLRHSCLALAPPEADQHVCDNSNSFDARRTSAAGVAAQRQADSAQQRTRRRWQHGMPALPHAPGSAVLALIRWPEPMGPHPQSRRPPRALWVGCPRALARAGGGGSAAAPRGKAPEWWRPRLWQAGNALGLPLIFTVLCSAGSPQAESACWAIAASGASPCPFIVAARHWWRGSISRAWHPAKRAQRQGALNNARTGRLYHTRPRNLSSASVSEAKASLQVRCAAAGRPRTNLPQASDPCPTGAPIAPRCCAAGKDSRQAQW